MTTLPGIVFDFGGVISAAQNPDFYPAVQKLTGWDRDTILAGWAKRRRAVDADFISIADLYRLIAADRSESYPDEVFEEIGRMDYDSWAVTNPETYTWAQELKAQGFRIGILTNMPTAFIPWFNRCAAPFRALADAEVVSGEEQMVKPNPAIYELMARRMGMPPNDLLFLDDTQINVDAAIACGWHAARFLRVEDGRNALAELLKTHG